MLHLDPELEGSLGRGRADPEEEATRRIVADPRELVPVRLVADPVPVVVLEESAAPARPKKGDHESKDGEPRSHAQIGRA